MRRGVKCKEDLLKELKQAYDDIVKSQYQGNYLKALENFDSLSENNLRSILSGYYQKQRSRDQAWKTCKGSLYEYAVFKYIQNVIDNNETLKDKLVLMMGDEALTSYGSQIVIRNWSDIFPDADILLINRKTNKVIAIFSCKTSLRERLTETAFWKRELEKTREAKDVKIIFVTTDKDNELRTETNRYILLHVIDCTFVTDPSRYREIIEAYKKKYGNREDFNRLLIKVRPINEIEDFLQYFLQIS